MELVSQEPMMAAGEESRGFLQSRDPYSLIAIFRRYQMLFLGVLVAPVLVSFVMSELATPRFTATAGVMLDLRKETVTGIQDVLSGLPADASVVDTEVEVLESRDLAERVVSKLRLDDDPEFNSTLRKKGFSLGLGSLFSSRRDRRAPPRDVVRRKIHESVVDAVMARLKVKRSGLTYLMHVSFESESAEKAATIANSFADLYLLEQLEAKFDATKKANAWLDSRLSDLRSQVQEAEAAVEQYKAANGLMSAQGATQTEQEIANLNQQVAAVKVQQAESEARLNNAKQQLARGSDGEDLDATLGSSTIANLRGRRAEVSGNLAQLVTRYGPRHPEVIKAQQQLNDLDGQIAAETKRIISSLESQAQVQRQRTASLMSSLASSRGTLAGNNRAAVHLHELERNAETVRALYEALLTRFKQTQEDFEQSDARVVSVAKIPNKPTWPNIPLNIAIGLALGIGAGVAAISLRETFDTGVETAEELEAALGIPCLAGIPTLASTLGNVKAKRDPVQHVVDKPMSRFSESLRSLRASLQLSRVGGPVKVIAIISSLPDEGKTTTSLCLARSMALAGDRVILLDCDLRRRAVGKYVAAPVKAGLIEVLGGAARLEDAIYTDTASGAHVLALTETAYTPKDVFGSAAMDNLLTMLRAKYDAVVLDTAPILPVAETRILAAKADVVAVLTRWRKTPRKATQAALKLLHSSDIFVAGGVLAQINAKAQARHGYGDPGYYRAYRRYFSDAA